MATTFLELPLELLHPAGDNLRVSLDEGTVEQLAASIRSIGLIEPLIVCPNGDGYEVIAGHHRLAALALAGESTAPCIVRQAGTDDDRWIVMLVENLQRRDLDPIEEAAGYQRLVRAGWAQRRIATTLGCSQGHVSKRVALAKLPVEAQMAIRQGRLGIADAEALTKVRDKKAIVELVGPDFCEKPVSSWEVRNLLSRQERAEREATARAELAGAGVEIVEDCLWFRSYERCDRADATHGTVDPSGTLLWLRPLVVADAGDDQGPGEDGEDEEARTARAERAEALRRAELMSHLWDRAEAHLTGTLGGQAWDPKAAQAYVAAWVVNTARAGIAEPDPQQACRALGLTVDPNPAGEGLDSFPGAGELARFAAMSQRAALKAAVAVAATDTLDEVRRRRWHDRDGVWADDHLGAAVTDILEYLTATGFEPTGDERAELDRRLTAVPEPVPGGEEG